MTQVIALDLGTTRIKGGRFDATGCLQEMTSADAPPLDREGPRCESSAEAYLAAATTVRDALLEDTRGDVALGVASQRSTFTIWDARTGQSVLPLISWQDRRAAAWCARHQDSEPMIGRLTGLRLSPHYAGPKLAAVMTEHPELYEGLERGTLRFGTLDSWVLWQWSDGALFETDHTMAARTLLADAQAPRWLGPLLDLFQVPASCVPAIEASCGRSVPLGSRVTVAASISDQSAAALAALGNRTDAALINLGTGGFVLLPTGGTMVSVEGYLSGPLLTTHEGPRFALEGTVNGAAGAVDRFAPAPTPHLTGADPTPDAFALPDDAGIGSPHWRADGSLTLSPAAQRLDPAETRRVVAEGIVFRVREILDGLSRGRRLRVVRLSGGLSRDPFFAAALAACLNRPIEVLEDGDQTLRGAGGLAAGTHAAPAVSGQVRHVVPAPDHAWLRTKYSRWRRWLQSMLG